MRRSVSVLLAIIVAGLAAGIFGEYEFRGVLVPGGAGVSVGYAVAVTLSGAGGWRGPVAGGVAALLAGSSVLIAGWIDSDEGVEAYPPLAFAAALVAVATAGAVAGRRAPTTGSSSTSPRRSTESGV